MTRVQVAKSTFVALLAFTFFCLGAGSGLCIAGQDGAGNLALGKLKLEGKDIDYLVLRGKDGHTERITRPGQTIELPAGRYALDEVRVKGGYIQQRIGRVDWIRVTQGQQEILKVGAPLVPALKVQREGRILQLSYELRGVGGGTYTGGDRSKPPTFAVYKGQRKIASGKFEYG